MTQLRARSVETRAVLQEPNANEEAEPTEGTAPVLVLAALVIAMCLAGLANAPVERADVLPPEPSRPPAAAVTALRDGRQLDLNSASQAELELLPRVGPAIAQRIVAARPFATVDELVRVSGVGPRTLERLRPLVFVGESEVEPRTAPR